MRSRQLRFLDMLTSFYNDEAMGSFKAFILGHPIYVQCTLLEIVKGIIKVTIPSGIEHIEIAL